MSLQPAEGERVRRAAAEALEGRWLLATINVTGTGDVVAPNGVVSLREAVLSANANANASVNADVVPVGTYGDDTIDLPAGTYNLTTVGPVKTPPPPGTWTSPATSSSNARPVP